MRHQSNSNHDSYYFYYDESEHSRKINLKTIEAENFSNNFIAVIIGYSNDSKEEIEKKFDDFKNKHSHRVKNNEIKSRSLKMKKGFADINIHNMSFVSDFFKIMDSDIIFYFSVINKIEYIINQMFAYYENNILEDMDRLRYIISKAVSIYRPDNVFDSIYNRGNIIEELKKFLKERITENEKNIKLKEKENLAFKETLELLDRVNEDFSIDWEYRISFDGFKKYLDERGINDYQLIIDKEGSKHKDSKTLLAAKNLKLKNVTEDESENHVGIQIADMMAGIISKFIKMLDDDLRHSNIKESTSKKLLPEKWFVLNEKQFLLYKKLGHIVNKLDRSWYKIYSGVYADQTLGFLSLLNYFDSYDNIQEFKKVESNMHAEYYNEHSVADLEEYFTRLQSKLALDVVNENDEFYYNQRGAKCYIDWTKHESLHIPNSASGVVYNVLSVGFFGLMEHPSITVIEDNQPICYLLPPELLDWAFNCISYANLGDNPFPAQVKFGVIDNRYYADKI